MPDAVPPPKLHSTGLTSNCLAALVYDFMASNRLGLQGIAAAADVIAAECRQNLWVLSHLKPANLSKEQWFAFLDAGDATRERCKAAMVAFESGGSLETLCAEFHAVASQLNDRTLPPPVAT
jgi:hypothetical protein